jgi:hypothetical protein
LTEYSNSDILGTIDYIVERVQDLKKIMLGVSISALVLAPFAIGLTLYLATHPRFFEILDTKDEFGEFLSILLAGIVIISGIWLYTGIRQYLLLSSWNRRYSGYINKKEELDRLISDEYNLNED